MSYEKSATAVGHIPSGIFIICSKNEHGRMDGYLASWVQQISTKPLMVSFTIKPDRAGYDVIKSGGVFSINIIGEHDTQFMRYFWNGYNDENNPFIHHLDMVESSVGGLHIKNAKSAIDCKFHSSIRPGDHEVIIAEVLNSDVYEEIAKPKVHIRKSGADY